MLTAENNELLCRVEGAAPMGQLMRRHWIPACLTEEVAEPDGAPVRVRLLGEDLVAFRDSKGRLGILEEYCPHRRASLFYGRNEECGLRCLYHGWKMDVEGNVVEMPSEPNEGRLVERVKHRSYPVREAGGFVWVYMGPPEEMPEFQAPVFAKSPNTRISIVKIHLPCNWAQVLEGAIDSAHSSSLHSSDIRAAKVERAGMTSTYMTRPSTDKSPRIQVTTTSYGFRYAAIRHPIKDADTHDYVRVTVFIAPFTVVIPPNEVYSLAQLNAPIDDTQTMFYFIAFSDKGPGIDQETWRKFCAAEVGIDLDQQYRKIRTRENNYLQDRQAMKLGDFTGITGIPNQDIAMWETMGPIADRSKERLGASDVAIVQFRKLMINAARTFRDGGQAIGTSEPRIPQVKIRSYEGVVAKATDWRTLGLSEEELTLLDKTEEGVPTSSSMSSVV
jgi:phthalate 4,5-dioxygenase oxygenase subunit